MTAEESVASEVKEIVDNLLDQVSSQTVVVAEDEVAASTSDQITRGNVVSPVVNVSQPALSDTDQFELRNITFMQSSKRIVMQNGDGPCPLIALVNALILKGSTVPATLVNNGRITRANLTNFVGDELIGRRRSSTQSNDDNDSKRVDDVLNILPRLGSGLMVNLKFHDVTAFEYTTAVDLFDLLGCRLFHAWLAEKGSTDYVTDDIGTKSYNVVAIEAFENENLKNFLLLTGAQMTYSGLFALRDVMRQGEIGVLFRNNHFHTILKRGSDLCLLCTDLGYKNAPSCVWEALVDIEGNSAYLNEKFRDISKPAAAPACSTNQDSIDDHELAKQLQRQFIQEDPSNQQNSSARNTVPEDPRQISAPHTQTKKRCTVS